MNLPYPIPCFRYAVAQRAAQEGAQDQLEDALAELVPQQHEEGLILSPVSELDVLEIRLEWIDHA